MCIERDNCHPRTRALRRGNITYRLTVEKHNARRNKNFGCQTVDVYVGYVQDYDTRGTGEDGRVFVVRLYSDDRIKKGEHIILVKN